MLLEILLTSIVALAFYLWTTRKRRHWDRKRLPHVKHTFPFGSVGPVFTMKKNMGEFFHDIYRSFPDSSAVGYYIFGEPAVLLREPELVKQVLVKEFNSFHDNAFRVSINVDPLFGINPFVTRGPKWKSVRAIHTPTHSTSKLKLMVKDMVEVSQNMVDYIKENKDIDVEAKELSGQFTLDVVARCGYGFEGDSFKGPSGVFRALTSGQVFASSFVPNLATICAEFAPRLPEIFRLRILSKQMEDFFVNMVRQARDHRGNTGLKRADLLQQLLDARDLEDPNKPAYTDLEVAGHCMTLFIDGTETSSLALGFLLFRLAKHPEVQTRLRQEIDSAVESMHSLTYDQIHTLTYLDMVLSETLRLHPPILLLGRLCTKETVLVGGDGRRWEIAKDQVVTVPVLGLHMDGTIFPEPDAFRPERFDEGNKDSFPKYAYLPFGEGPRICIGQKFAVTQIKIAVIAILKKFQIVTNDPHQVPFKLDPMSTFVCMKKDGLWIKFIER